MKRSIFTLFLILHSILLLNAQNVSVYPNLGHRGLVASFAFNTELNILASVSIGESFIKLWDADNAREIKTIPTEATFFHSIIWNNTTLICGLWSGEIIFIDFNSGDELHRWKAHRGSVNSLHLNHDKNELLSASFDGTIKKWDALTGKEIAIVKDINASVNRAIYSSNGNFIVAAFSDGTVRKYDTVNNNELLVIQAHTGHVLSIDCNSDASLIISGGFDGILKTWNNGELRQSATTNSSPVTSVALSPDNERAVSGSTDGILYEWNISTGQKLNEFFSHEMSISNVQYKNNEIVYSASYDNRIKEWQMTSKEEVNHFSSYSDIVNSIVLSSNGEYIISGHSQVNDLSDSCIYIWESKTGALVNTLERQKKGILSVDITPDGKTIASGSEDAIVRIWDIENNTVLHTLYGHNTFVTTVSFSPDGTKLASSSYDGTVKIWDTNTGRFITEYKIEEQRIFDVKWNPNGNQLAAAANGVHFWDLQFPINSFVIETEPIHNITYNPDGSRLAGGTQQNTLYIWDTKKGEEIFSKEGDINANIIALCYSPNGMYIAFAIQNVYQTLIDTSIKIWDAETGDLLTQLDGHDSTVTDIHFTQDSKRIISS
ncbi:MAG: WD40 repeat domain-containing protein, partial [Treponema sp.]|nr:WD40 repeat domain-containing protein [Treponema sp.]